MTIVKRAQALGFVVVQTGGNCTAWRRVIERDGKLAEQFITLEKDPVAPSWKTNKVVIGTYTVVDGLWDVISEGPFTFGELLDRLEQGDA